MILSRAIPLDKYRLKKLAETLQGVIEKKTKNQSGPLGRSVLVEALPFDIKRADGVELDIFIRILTIPTSSRYFVVSGGIGKTRSGQTAIVIHFNGSEDAEAIHKSAAGSDLIANEIYKVLIHEVTHAADILGKGYGLSEEEAQAKPEVYYNDPSEIRAYLQEILEELENRIKYYPKFVTMFKGRGKGLMNLMNMSSTWKELEPYLTESNKRLILKSVALKVDQWESEQGRKDASLVDRVVSRYLGT